jgi:hypothetical protein
MKQAKLTFIAVCGVMLLLVNSGAAQESPAPAKTNSNTRLSALNVGHDKPADANASGSSSKVESLKHRVEEVENQNRLLMQIVTELKAKLDGANTLEAKRASAAPAAQPADTPAAQSPTPPAQADNNQPVRWPDLVSQGNRIKFYGFLRLDMDIDSQHPNNTQTPLFINSPDPALGGNTNGDFSMHPRLTRLGINFSGPHIAGLGDAKLSGQLETDFENGGTESRQIIRIRHAYLRLDWRDFSLLAGQTWDTVSPLFPTVNNDTLQWNAGNVGDRRPQLRAAYEPKVGRGKFSFTGGIGLTGAIDALDLDNNGFRDGEESSRPDVQGRIGYAYPIGHDRSASFGISSFYGFLKTARPIAGRTDYHIQLTNVDFTLPLASFFALRGEGWWGRNMSDVRGGAGQGINLANGREIRGRGGWSEANIKVSRFLSLNPGFSTDDPVDEDIPNGGRTRNRAFYLANRITPGGNFLIGADYLRWLTSYKGLRRGLDNRVNLFLQYNF